MNSTVEELRHKTDTLESDIGLIYEGMISAGENTLTLNVPVLTNESMIDVYTDKFGVSPLSVETDVVAKTVKLTFEIQTEILKVKVKVGE